MKPINNHILHGENAELLDGTEGCTLSYQCGLQNQKGDAEAQVVIRFSFFLISLCCS
jgi:hypothetical protein